jgi:hypothetical protein
MDDSAENIRIGTNWLKSIFLGLNRLRQNPGEFRYSSQIPHVDVFQTPYARRVDGLALLKLKGRRAC